MLNLTGAGAVDHAPVDHAQLDALAKAHADLSRVHADLKSDVQSQVQSVRDQIESVRVGARSDLDTAVESLLVHIDEAHAHLVTREDLDLRHSKILAEIADAAKAVSERAKAAVIAERDRLAQRVSDIEAEMRSKVMPLPTVSKAELADLGEQLAQVRQSLGSRIDNVYHKADMVHNLATMAHDRIKHVAIIGAIAVVGVLALLLLK